MAKTKEAEDKSQSTHMDLLKMKLRESVDSMNEAHDLIDEGWGDSVPRFQDNKLLTLKERIQLIRELESTATSYLTKRLKALREKLL
jgi:hypothetical protein